VTIYNIRPSQQGRLFYLKQETKGTFGLGSPAFTFILPSADAAACTSVHSKLNVKFCKSRKPQINPFKYFFLQKTTSLYKTKNPAHMGRIFL